MCVCLTRIAAQVKEENDSVWTCITLPAGKLITLRVMSALGI